MNIINKMKFDMIMTAIVAIILGIIFIVLPNDSADLLCKISGTLLCFVGIFDLIYFFMFGSFISAYSFITGIVLILFGCVCILHPNMIEEFLTIIFGLFIILDGANSLRDSIYCMKVKIPGGVSLCIMSAIIIILGCIVMFGTFDTIITFAGIVLIIDGILDLFITAHYSYRVQKAKKRNNYINVDFRER